MEASSLICGASTGVVDIIRLLIILAASFTTMSGFAQKSGEVARAISEIKLYSGPSSTTPVIGRIERGTLVTCKGEIREKFIWVSLELETGWVDGWVEEAGLDFGETPQAGNEPPATASKTPMPERGFPRDEKVLLRRERHFFYNIEVGGNFGIFSTSDNANFQGPGLIFGGGSGFFVTNVVSVSAHGSYHWVNGTGDNYDLNFGFLEAMARLTLQLSLLQVWAGGGYAIGLNVPESINPVLNVQTANDFSSPAFAVGAAFFPRLHEIARTGIGIQYRFHLYNTPLSVQSISVVLALGLEG
jgi:hypothetical protein